MKTPEGILVIPTSYEELNKLLASESLAAVEQAIASKCGLKTFHETSLAVLSHTKSEISVSGMNTVQIEEYLKTHQGPLIEFGIRFLSDEKATSEDEEYPEGEEQEPPITIESLGYANGFAITIAIYHNFLSNRTPAEFRAYLKNRRIPKHAKFLQELTRIFTESNQKR